MGQVNWFDRKFDFSGNQNIMPSVIERLEGTPVRIAEKLKHIDPSLYTIKMSDTWSILEHIGHLTDLEPLWVGRLEDILAGETDLRPTDLTNRQTTEANHNSKSPSTLLAEFTSIRRATVDKLNSLNDDDVFKSALHPRLKTPMKTIDLFTFVAEHDDHHLAKITEIVRLASSNS
jgi:uncharacterized damage-inducible protein DinB